MSEACRAHAPSASYVAEDELHAYVDGQLHPTRRAVVESWLGTAPAEQQRLQDYRQQNIELHRLFDGAADEDASEECERLAGRLQRALVRQNRVRRFARGAAFVAMVALAAGVSWSGLEQRLYPENPMTAFARQATEAHMMAVGRAKTLAAARETAAASLDDRPQPVLGIPVPSPDLAKIGFSLVGGRILPTARGPAVQLLYASDKGGKVTLFVGTGAPANRAAFTILDEEGMTLVYWQIGDLGYSLIGNVDRTRLLALAESVIDSLPQAVVASKRERETGTERVRPEVAATVQRIAEEKSPREKVDRSLPKATPIEAELQSSDRSSALPRMLPSTAGTIGDALGGIVIRPPVQAGPAPKEPKLSAAGLKPPT